MTHQIVIALVLLLGGGTGLAPSTAAARTSYASEAELLELPGSGGYLIDGEFVGEGDEAAPVPACEEGEGDEDDSGYDGDDGDEEPGAGDTEDGGAEDAAPGSVGF